MGVFLIKAAFCRLHGIASTPAAFLHHDCHEEFHISFHAVFLCDLLDGSPVSQHLIADTYRHGKTGSGAAKEHGQVFHITVCRFFLLIGQMKDVICKVGISGIADRVGMAGKSNLSGWCIFLFRRNFHRDRF